ncbi:hypothetical protein B5F53_04375 [Blautia sp. An249]|uniref:hypothetical protein n=1 Tax=Blautia sp. An249 TaxID=1965603 RepID=UPI000B389C91|nr:hypothetical protein [Blautia sp. An249]OUO80206.1 hypothetical protein B5F53_04375 [Blautia sp. An249]
MRKEKLFALALAGILAVSSAPAVFAAEADPTGVEDSSGDQEEAADSENPEEEETGNPEEEEPTEEDTSETDGNEADNPSANPEDVGAENSINNSPGANVPAEQADTDADQVPVVNSAKSLQEEINKLASAANKTGEIRVNADFALDSTITVPAGVTVTLAAKEKQVTLSRAAGFKGAMFDVKGSLTVGTDNNADPVLIINGSLKEGEADGSILNVSGSLTMKNNVTLSGNKTSEKVKGGAIYNTGSLHINGGVIKDNTSGNGGAIYSEKTIYISGSAKIYNNQKRDNKTKDNIVLKKGSVLCLEGKLTAGANVAFHIDGDVSADDTVVQTTNKPNWIKTAVNENKLSYEGRADVVLGTDGRVQIKRIPVVADVNDYTTPDKKSEYKPGESIKYEVVGAGFDNTEPGEDDVRWKPYSFTVSSEKVWADGLNQYIISGYQAPKDTEFGDDEYIIINITITFIKQTYQNGEWVTGSEKQSVQDPITLAKGDSSSTPAGATIHKASDNEVDVEKKDVPKNTPIKFEAIGAGMDADEKKLVEGSNRWKPIRWGVEGIDEKEFTEDEHKEKDYSKSISTKTSSFKVNSEYELYVVFQEETFENGVWVEVADSTDTISKPIKITKAPTATPTKKVTKKPTITSKGSKSNTKKASNTKTGDESPILPLTVLCMASLATGGYVLVRRRKKSEN